MCIHKTSRCRHLELWPVAVLQYRAPDLVSQKLGKRPATACCGIDSQLPTRSEKLTRHVSKGGLAVHARLRRAAFLQAAALSRLEDAAAAAV